MSLSGRARALRRGGRRSVYVGAATESDRFVGQPCGCVFLVRWYTLRPANSEADAEAMYGHVSSARGTECVRWNCAASSTYHYGPLYGTGQEGIPWQ